MARSIAAAESISLGNPAVLNNMPGPYSIAFWYKKTSYVDGGFFFTKGALHFGDFSASINDQMRLIKTASGVDLESRSVLTFSVADGWVHIAIVVTSGKLGKIYKNGTETTYSVQTAGVGTLTDDSASPFIFSGSSHPGSIVELGIWDVALSPTDVTNLAAGRLPTTISSGLIRHAPLRGATPEPETITDGTVTLVGTSIVADPVGLDPEGGGDTVATSAAILMCF